MQVLVTQRWAVVSGYTKLSLDLILIHFCEAVEIYFSFLSTSFRVCGVGRSIPCLRGLWGEWGSTVPVCDMPGHC